MVREDPFSLILLDEIEKAHPNILNLFLQILDEGHVTDGAGRMVDFKNTIIIATSNAGAELIRTAINEEKNLQEYKEEFINEILKQGIFRPEFLNRFDAVVLFRTLTKENLIKIAEIMLGDIKNGLSEKEINFIITSELREKIAELGFNPEFGAREMKRVLQDKVENNIAKVILAGKIKAGDSVEMNAETFEIKLVEK
jgi:ATP-dependent Clp protease ATP-binding subunit ClpA